VKTAAFLLLITLLNGCSAGRYYKPQDQTEGYSQRIGWEDATLINALATSCEMPHSELERRDVNTIFVHPGLLLLNLNWDKSLAVDTAGLLIKHGYAKDFLELRDRDTTRIGDRMQKDPGTRFIGLHYSMGGQPQLLAAALASVEQARRESGKDLVYSPILVDPFDIEHVNTLLDVNAPHLGQIFICSLGRILSFST
jgi:hypothetical protein